MPAGRQGRNDVADYRPGLCSGLTPAPVTSNPSYHPAGRLAGVAALYATSVWRRWDQQCLSRFRSRSALRLVNAVRTCPGCHLGANTSAHAHTYTARDTHTHTHTQMLHVRPISILISLSFSLCPSLSPFSLPLVTFHAHVTRRVNAITTGTRIHPLTVRTVCDSLSVSQPLSI